MTGGASTLTSRDGREGRRLKVWEASVLFESEAGETATRHAMLAGMRRGGRIHAVMGSSWALRPVPGRLPDGYRTGPRPKLGMARNAMM